MIQKKYSFRVIAHTESDEIEKVGNTYEILMVRKEVMKLNSFTMSKGVENITVFLIIRHFVCVTHFEVRTIFCRTQEM